MSKNSILFILVVAQFACVSLWFLPNALIAASGSIFNMNKAMEGLTSMVQLGFILGTLCYAMLSFADRYSPSKVFFFSAILAALCNFLLLVPGLSPPGIYGVRLLTGFFIAGVYPVGMKIASDYYAGDISKALGYLLGALVLGTAFPHLLNSAAFRLSWSGVVITTSILATLGGILVWWKIPDGPFRKSNPGWNPNVILTLFRKKSFRKTAFGYFGHMWELYAFWSFVPILVRAYLDSRLAMPWRDVSAISFFVIATGALTCVLGGYWARKVSSYTVAFVALIGSAICCLVSPFMISAPVILFLAYLLFWGGMVIMDSPQFSSLIAYHAPAENRGTALTFVNCIGFSITIISILTLGWLSEFMDVKWLLLFLAPGPVLGILFFLHANKASPEAHDGIINPATKSGI